MKTMLLAAALVAVAAVPAAAAPGSGGGGGGGGWEPTSTPPFVIPAGQVCAFEVKGDIVADREWMRTPATFPDGKPQVQDFRGVLVIRYTNTGNGRSVVRDATGSIRVYSLPDGSRIQQLHGHNALPVRAANTGFPGGDYITSGDFVVIDRPGGVREIPVQLGTMENLCKTLA
ncbi:hypothetical protein [Actinoplanes nipponensis]|uniref:hypothetical protein n=1 Tax=Actinoplanes nipponensis TaxID=135950 RepID=UPI00194325A2|nr:hypothetical protein [Actinoplanes nipponensis]